VVLVYTDGACDPNPGKGGWGAVIIRPDETIRKISGSERKETTNNRMEMTAVLMALRELLPVDGPVVVRSDSELLVKTLKRQYGRKANLDLWRELDREVARFPAISFEWVRGHAGDRYNEMADQLANRAMRSSSDRPANSLSSNKLGMKCNKCRLPMRPFAGPDPKREGPQWFRCNRCRISGYKDHSGAHYLPDSYFR
jgi:ribonuclease HI